MLLRVFILCLCLNITIYGNWDTFTKSIFKHDLNTILADPLYNVVDVGVQLNKLNKKESDILFKHNADKKFIPASTMKVVLTTVVLSNFGRDYQFKTPVLTDGIIKNHILYGNLYLVGRGDPSLSDADITELVRSIKSKGITQVVGDIVYDDSFLDEEILKKHSNARHYYAPPSALNLNYNQLFCKIGYTSNKIPYVYIKPSTSYAKLNTSLSFIKKTKAGRPEMTYKQFSWGDSYRIKGKVSQADIYNQYLILAVTRPGLYVGTTFKERLNDHGIKVKGQLRKGITPKKTVSLVHVESQPVSSILKILNHDSNNMIAAVLNKNLGAYFDSIPGTKQKGLDIMEKFCVKKLSINNEDVSFHDGSGLSKLNRITPSALSKILFYGYKNSYIKPVLFKTLVKQGVHPYHSEPAPPEHLTVLVKTGTLATTGVNSMVGYIINEATKEVYSFVIMAQRKYPGRRMYTGTLTSPILKLIFEYIS